MRRTVWSARQHGRPLRRRSIRVHEGADAVERFRGDAAAVTQAAGELAIVDGAPAEGRLGKSGVTAIFGDFLQQFLRVHRGIPVPGSSSGARAALLRSFS